MRRDRKEERERNRKKERERERERREREKAVKRGETWKWLILMCDHVCPKVTPGY